MRIGVDIDGVLNYRQEFVLAYGAKYCAEKNLLGIRDVTSHNIGGMLGLTQEERDEFWWKYGKYQMWVWPARCFAAEVIQKLRAEGHEIFIVTGRSNSDLAVDGMPAGWTWEDVTKEWLAQNDILYDHIGFGWQGIAPNDKGTYCVEQNIDVMIDDLPEYLETLVGKTGIFVFDQPYNQEVKLPGMQRVYSWYDIYRKIKALEAQDTRKGDVS